MCLVLGRSFGSKPCEFQGSCVVFKYLAVDTSLLEHPIVGVHMSVNFLDDRLDKFLCIWLFECLLKIHDVTCHFCMKRDRVSHTLLKSKMGIVEEVFIRIASSSLRCHVVHTLVSVEIPLVPGFRFSL
jgi:hypothetical protein